MTVWFTEIDTNGKIVNSGSCPAEAFEFQTPQPGNTIIELQSNPETQYVDTQTNTAMDVPAAPSQYHKFNYSTKQYELNDTEIAKAVLKIKTSIEQKRQSLELSNIIYDNKTLQADAEAIKNINGKLQELYARDANARPMQQSEMVWRDADNTVHQWNSQTIYKQWLQNFTIEIAARGTALYQIAWTKKAEIDAIIANPALTNEQKLTELLNYDIETGWNI